MTPASTPTRRPILLAALFAVAALLGLTACSSSNGGGGGGEGTTRVGLRIVIQTGTGLRGVEVDMNFDASFELVSVQETGIFLGDTCEANVGATSMNLVCVQNPGDTFDAPTPAWSLTVDHPDGVNPTSLVSLLSCIGSDDIGNTFPVGCTLE